MLLDGGLFHLFINSIKQEEEICVSKSACAILSRNN